MSDAALAPPPAATGLLATRLELPKGAERGLALLVPGSGPAEAQRLAGLARALVKEGIACLHLPEDAEGASLSPAVLAGAIQAAAMAAAAGGRAVPLLVGLGDGAAAVLLAAENMPKLRAIALLDPKLPEGATGERCCRALEAIARPVLLLHDPEDGAREADAMALYRAAGQPKTLAALGHGSSTAQAGLIAAWAAPICLTQAIAEREAHLPAVAEGGVLYMTELAGHRYTQAWRSGRHLLLADEPAGMGGEDLGPPPFQLLLAALGACTAMTLRMYAERKDWPLERVDVALSSRMDGNLQIERDIGLEGPLDAVQRARLMEIANKCPVHKALSSAASIKTGERVRSPGTPY